MPVFKRLGFRAAVLAVVITLFSGCASTLGDPRDPFEPMNRGIYQVNDAVDRAIFKPIAEGYRYVLPSVIRTGVSNFFSNIGDVLVALNNLLQGKVAEAASDLGRIVINSTFGIGGLFDVATVAGLEKHDEDFGQTLGRWGFGDGPFLMLPIFGPSNFRDTVGRLVDLQLDPLTYIRPRHARNITWGVKFVQRRSELLDAGTILETAALDPYEFIRDAYLQRRRNLIYDGSPPPDQETDLDVPRPRGSDEKAPVASAPIVTAQGPVMTSQGSIVTSQAQLTESEIDALVQSLPPMVPRRTARAASYAPSGL